MGEGIERVTWTCIRPANRDNSLSPVIRHSTYIWEARNQIGLTPAVLLGCRYFDPFAPALANSSFKMELVSLTHSLNFFICTFTRSWNCLADFESCDFRRGLNGLKLSLKK